MEDLKFKLNLMREDKLRKTYFPLLKLITEDYSIKEDNFEKKVNEYVKSNKIAGLEKRILDLLLYVNPKKENFKNDLNRKYIFDIFEYLLAKKGYDIELIFKNDNDKGTKQQEISCS